MNKRNRAGAVLLCFFLGCLLFGCGNPETTVPPEEERPLIADTISFNESKREDKINWYGRCYHDTQKGNVSISNSSAGFEVAFYGTTLSARISATASAWKAPELSGNGYLCVFLDGETKYENATCIELSDTSGEPAVVLLAEGLEKGEHTARIIKITEVKYTQAYVWSVTSDGGFVAPPSKPAIKLELIGDSITAGANAMREDTADETGTDSENSLASYGAVAARMLGAQCNVVARSGLTVAGGESGTRFAKIADYYGLYSEKDNIAWDFTQYVPDAVVIDLGTNDLGVSTSESKIKSAYTDLIATVRQKYPQAHIFCCTGAMGNFGVRLAPLINRIVNDKAAAGDMRIYHVELHANSTAGHPTAQQHVTNGIRLYAQIKAKLGL